MKRTGVAQDTAPAAQHTVRPRLAPASASAADSRAPRDSETDRGAEEGDGATRRRWLLRRNHLRYDVRLDHAHLVDPSIATIATARGGGDEHGGARPRHVRLRRGYGAAALTGGSTGFSRVHRT